MTQILVSQNVPYNSPMEVTINDPVDNVIECSQVWKCIFFFFQFIDFTFFLYFKSPHFSDYDVQKMVIFAIDLHFKRKKRKIYVVRNFCIKTDS